jgi:hypothetical protein
MRLNWGYKIILVYGLFVLGMMFLVFKSTQQKYDLVQKDYYAEELKFQNVIDASQHAKNLGGELITSRQAGHLLITLPVGFQNAKVIGSAHLYYAADENKDINSVFETTNGKFKVELLSKMSGAYTLKLNVDMKGEQYYYEQRIFF